MENNGQPDYSKIFADYAPQNGDSDVPLALFDMPDTVLSGRLGEICQRRMKAFPISYSWPALLAVASAMLETRNKLIRTNLYVALVGPVHSGKTQALEHAIEILGCKEPVLLDLLSGSGEQLIRKVKDAEGKGRLFSPDELGHLFEKMRIERSSFSFILNRAYYKNRFEVAMGKKENVIFDCSLSIAGGIVEEKFQSLFDSSATGGLYDRFLFGFCPRQFDYDYFPFEGETENISPGSVYVEPSVWEAKSALLKARRDHNPRVMEHAIRTAVVCAAYDGKKILKGTDLVAAFELAKNQTAVRLVLRPNPGENQEARVALKFLDYLDQKKGKYVTRRELLHNTRSYELGPSNGDRALAVLISNGDIERLKVGKQILFRRPTAIEMEEQ